VGEVIEFPKPDQDEETPRCKGCGLAIVLTQDEKNAGVTRDLCFCCAHTILLPFAPPNPCPECAATGRVSVHVCRDADECERNCPKLESCTACLGTGRRT
jgi:hypothetical protein